MLDNPWQVDSIDAFLCFKCPECLFNSKEEEIFQDHAVENHQSSLVLFGKTPLKKELDESFVILEEEPNISDYLKDEDDRKDYSQFVSTSEIKKVPKGVDTIENHNFKKEVLKRLTCVWIAMKLSQKGAN